MRYLPIGSMKLNFLRQGGATSVYRRTLDLTSGTVQTVYRIDDVAYPVPTQYVIMFYSEGRFLFDAKLNSALSSYLPTGLTFCHLMTHESGESWYDLGTIYVTSQDGHTEGEPTEQQAAGMRRMYQILEEAGKLYHKK